MGIAFIPLWAAVTTAAGWACQSPVCQNSEFVYKSDGMLSFSVIGTPHCSWSTIPVSEEQSGIPGKVGFGLFSALVTDFLAFPRTWIPALALPCKQQLGFASPCVRGVGVVEQAGVTWLFLQASHH